MTYTEFSRILDDIDDEHAAMDALVSLAEEDRDDVRHLILQAAKADEAEFIDPLIGEMERALLSRKIRLLVTRKELHHSIQLTLRLERLLGDVKVSSANAAAILIKGHHKFSFAAGGKSKNSTAMTIKDAAEEFFRDLYLDFDTQKTHPRAPNFKYAP